MYVTGWPTEFLKKFQNNSRTFQEHFHIFQEHADGQDEVIFSHKWNIQTGGNHKCCNLRSRSSKILNSRTIPEHASTNIIKYISSTKKIPEPLATLCKLSFKHTYTLISTILCKILMQTFKNARGTIIVLKKDKILNNSEYIEGMLQKYNLVCVKFSTIYKKTNFYSEAKLYIYIITYLNIMVRIN